MAEPDPLLTEPVPGETTLVKKPGVPEVLTARRETDCRAAITRGLREYLEQARFAGPDGKLVRFARVYDTWADPEEEGDFPNAAIYSPDDGDYDAHSFTPQTYYLAGAEPAALRKASEFTTSLRIEAWCSNPKQREHISMLLEDVLDPVDWMSGFLLQLPHYHSARARFLKGSSAYADAMDTARRNVRLVTVTLQASVDHFVLTSTPRLDPRFDQEVDGQRVAAAVSS